MGNTLQELGRLEDAEKSYKKAIAIKPDYAEAYSNLGNTLQELGRLEDAETNHNKAIAIKPDYAEAYSNLGNTLQELGRLEDAETNHNKAIAIKPDYAEAYSNLGNTLQELGRLEDAEKSYKKAIAIKPDYAEAYSNLGNTLQELGRLEDAETNHNKAIAIKPDYAKAYYNLGNTLQELGRLEDAEKSYNKAIAFKPDLVEAHSNFIFYSSHNSLIDAEELYARHFRFGQLFEAPLRSHWPQYLNSSEPERCLKIGFVSADLREHAMATFIGPLLELWAHYPKLSLYAYYNHSTNDRITEQLKRHFAHWQVVVGLPDAALADKIRADGIDILFDLSGHTDKHRLLTFARKPAPIQVSWMGYPGTTGLMAIDYYFCDRFHLQLGELNAQFTEKIVYLPANAPFQQMYKTPPVNTLPSLKNGYVTFGSFNRSNKLGRPVVALWSQLLRALPSSRMLLGGMPKVRDFDWLIDWFAQEGISSERLSFHRRCNVEAYLDLHHEVDICLDTFPYGGGTTSCHALWMGVPTLTLAGQTMPSRVGACVQSHADLGNFVCHHEAEFIEKGLYWSNHLTELATIRARLRERFKDSAMGQASVIAASVERALRIMWQRWCAGLPAESFEVSTINTGNRQAEGS